MPHTNRTLVAVLATLALGGCAANTAGGSDTTDLKGTKWAVESIEGQAIVAGSQPTIEFGEENRVAGMASCNRWGAEYSRDGQSIRLTRPIATLMACAPPLMAQETRFLEVLPEVTRVEVRSDGRMTLSTPDGRTIAARRAN